MNEQPSLFARLKQARVVQVLVVYLGVSWVVLQLVGTLKELLVLPDWIGPVTLVLLGAGLLVVGATAWVQSLDSTTEAEQAGEVPTDWQVDAADIFTSLKAGRLPHLTWGRAILSLVVTISLAIGAAGGYVLITGGTALLGPTEAGADVVAEGIAVLPFHAIGEDLALYREGMVDLLSANFDGIGGFRTIDSRTVLARWEEEVGEVTRPDLEAALRAAGRTGARYAILGSIVPAGPQVRLDVDIYDVDDGSNVGSARVEGSPDEILSLVDGLSIGIARELLGAVGEQAATDRRLASITTNSVSALKDYLEGERLFRLGSFEAGAEALERAVATDSTFALAWARLSSTLGWASARNERAAAAREQARRLEDRLSPREASLNEARWRYNKGRSSAITLLEDYVRRYPDDAEAWYDLGDGYYHLAVDMQGLFPSSRAQARNALQRSAELDPGFSPYLIHVIDFAFAEGDSATAREAIDAYRASGGVENTYSRRWEPGFSILFGDEQAARAGIEAALELGQPARALGLVGEQVGVDRVPRELQLKRAQAETMGEEDAFRLLSPVLLRAGRWKESDGLLADPPGAPSALASVRISSAWRMLYGLGDAQRVHDGLSLATCGEPVECFQVASMKARHGALDGHPAEVAEGLEASTDALEGMLAMPQVQEIEFLGPLFTALVDDLPAWVDLLSGDAGAALEAWRGRDGGIIDHLGAAWAADEVGDFEFAERYYLASNWRQNAPFPTYRLARMYERMGRADDALVQYRRLALMWADADGDFEPWVEVQDALARLGGG